MRLRINGATLTRPVAMLAITVVLCAVGQHDHSEDHVRQGRPARATHATKPASTKHLELQEAWDARAAQVNLAVAAIIEGMTSARRVAALETSP
jgi:hypothetical protein